MNKQELKAIAWQRAHKDAESLKLSGIFDGVSALQDDFRKHYKKLMEAEIISRSPKAPFTEYIVKKIIQTGENGGALDSRFTEATIENMAKLFKIKKEKCRVTMENAIKAYLELNL